MRLSHLLQRLRVKRLGVVPAEHLALMRRPGARRQQLRRRVQQLKALHRAQRHAVAALRADGAVAQRLGDGVVRRRGREALGDAGDMRHPAERRGGVCG